MQAGGPADADALVALGRGVGAEPEGWLIYRRDWRSVATSGATCERAPAPGRGRLRRRDAGGRRRPAVDRARPASGEPRTSPTSG